MNRKCLWCGTACKMDFCYRDHSEKYYAEGKKEWAEKARKEHEKVRAAWIKKRK